MTGEDGRGGAGTSRAADGAGAPSSDLGRFVAAQDEGGTWERALGELRRGRKTTHWMWFVLPQLLGLGTSPTAVRYGLPGLAAARAYAAHPVLGPRLRTAVGALADLPATAGPVEVLGPVDAVKLRSCLTLFAVAEPDEPLYAALLERWYDGRPDPATLDLLGDATS
ncbi:DUF1810 domain-containing protein [Cellulomonas endophytica]|uniref:DUF1810 domain-containing protein n=1 Tax=Cellulomonas endophytica TaxID=2494735 RepID=UPI00101124E9|nr:DUF1810 domain-containing protein [Cellulomonas endophytica]